jgi:ABC-type polysaccharide/polyol phosphate export permease
MALAVNENPSFLHSLQVQRRVLAALFMREVLTRFGRHNLGFLWLFVEPMIFTLGVTALWTATESVHGSDLPIVAFALTGYSSVLLWRNMPGRCIGALWHNLSLMYHRNIRVLDVYLARLMLEFGGATISFTVHLDWLARSAAGYASDCRRVADHHLVRLRAGDLARSVEPRERVG